MPVYGNAGYGSAVVGTSAIAIGAPLGNRTNITIWNADAAATVYVGTDANVTVNTGIPIPATQFLSLDFGPQIPLYAICASGTISVRWFEAY